MHFYIKGARKCGVIFTTVSKRGKTMWTGIGLLGAFVGGFAVGTMFGKKWVKKAVREAIELGDSAQDAVNRIRRKIGA